MKRVRSLAAKWWARNENTVLILAGFGFISAGMFAVGVVAGLWCTGVSCLIIARLNEGGRSR